MKMLYADYDTSRKAYVWKNPQIPDGLCDFQFYSGDSFVVTADKFWQIEEGGQQKAYLITSAQPDNPSWGAHTEAPLLSVSIFRRDRLNWRIDIQNSALGCFGTFGTAPPVGLLRWGANNYALRVDPVFTNMGETIASTLVFAPLNGRFKKILELSQSHYDDCTADTAGCSRTDSKLHFLPKAGEPYYDLQVITTDTAAGRTGSRTQLYRFNGDKYAPVS